MISRTRQPSVWLAFLLALSTTVAEEVTGPLPQEKPGPAEVSGAAPSTSCSVSIRTG